MEIEILMGDAWEPRSLATWKIDAENGGISYVTVSGTQGHAHKTCWRKV